MRRLRGLGHGVGVLAWAVALAPLPALLAATSLDRGPDGAARWALFPAVLTAFDPFVWESARNSLVLAAAVTIAARVVGVGLARIAVRWRHFGRALLAALAIGVVVVPPACAAVGLRGWFAVPETWPQAAEWPWLPRAAEYLAWFWVELLVAAPIVAWSVSHALRGVDPACEDAARLSGASRHQAWRQIVWPVVRPDAARALALVFTWTLLEPGAPWVLGLRRTLAFQTVFSARERGVGAMSRAAVLAVGAIAMAALGRTLIGWWGGSARTETPLASCVPRPSQARLMRATGFLTLWGGVLFLAWMPTAGLVAIVIRGGRAFECLRMMRNDPLMLGYVTNALMVGVAAVVVDLMLSRFLMSWSRPGGGWPDRLVSGLEVIPPLAVGVGVLALPEALRMVAESFPRSTWRPSPAELLLSVAEVFDVDRTPWIALVFAVALVRLPRLAVAALKHRRALQPLWIDAALSLGAAPRAARRIAHGRHLGVSWSGLILGIALAVTNVTPALLFTPTADIRTVGPAVLTLVDEPGSWPRAALLSLGAIAVNLLALVVFAVSERRVVADPPPRG